MDLTTVFVVIIVMTALVVLAGALLIVAWDKFNHAVPVAARNVPPR